MTEIRIDTKSNLSSNINNRLRLRRQYIIAFWITLAISIGLMIGGFFVPPVGQIDGSVLTAIGELFLWPALAFGAEALSEGKKAKFKKGDTTLEVGESGSGDGGEKIEYIEGIEDSENRD